VVRGVKVPVLVAARAFAPITKVLLAFDGGASSQRALERIAQSPIMSALEVTVVTVGDSPAVEARLEAAQAHLQTLGVAAKTVLVAGQPETALGKLVEEQGFDLLVMGAYGHSRIRSMIIGSTTTEMIRSCKVPVLLVR
ncbi:universal stress protein, partial [Pseudorhodobacter sp.]|uniref:universal stress protein n=1 Tax=Pseudorhodobacter sp. TaxID=1934400 RepID=UPI0026486992